MTYQNTFGGSLIYPTQTGINEISLTGNLALQWPFETAPNSNLMTPIVDLSSSGAFTVTLPSALQASSGACTLFTNQSAFTLTIATNLNGTQVCTIAPGAAFLVYLKTNASQDGTWGAIQYGAQVSAPTAAALAGAGIIAVGTVLSQSIPISGTVSNYTITNVDRAVLRNWTGGAGTITLPLAASVGNNFYTQVRNSGSSSITVLPSGADLINGVATLTMSINDSAFIVTDGVGWYTIGLGAAVNNNFNPVTISVAGLTGTYVLPANQYAKTAYTFTGAMAGNLQVVVPATAYQYWVNNQATGGTLSIGISGQASPPLVGAGGRFIFYYNPFEAIVIPVNTASISTPVSILNGGTGQTTAASARNALGSTSVGDAVFISANTAAAQVAMSSPSTADALAFAMSC